MQEGGGKGSSVARDDNYEFEDFSESDSDATQNSSWSDSDKDDDKDDTEDSDMDIFDDDSDKGDEDAIGFGVFMDNKSKELSKFTSFSPIVTCSFMEDFTNLLNDPSEQEMMDLLSIPVFTDALTTSVAPNPEGNPEVLGYLSGASEVPVDRNNA
ncbi:hypothetical protein Tco_0693245 [Tanacetum coccineum]